MTTIHPLYFDTATGDYRAASASDTIDAIHIPGSEAAGDSSSLTFVNTDTSVALAVGDVIGVAEAVGSFTLFNKVTSSNRLTPVGVVYSVVDEGGGAFTYKAKLSGVLDTADVVGGSLSLTNTGNVWLSSTGTLLNQVSPPTAVEGGQTVQVGSVLSASKLLIKLQVMLYD